jgi:hypothetical protein
MGGGGGSVCQRSADKAAVSVAKIRLAADTIRTVVLIVFDLGPA